MKQIHECYIKVLSPLHIGCDEIYEPTGFVVDESRETLTAFDPVAFVSRMDKKDKTRFSEICKKGTVESILEMYQFLRRKPAEGKTVTLCKGFISHYNKTLSMSIKDRAKIQKELNNFAISRTSFLASDERAYIPGSALKGSLRTAYLNHANRIQHPETPGGKNAAKDLEKKLLFYSDFSADPFRLVKVSDFMPVGEVQTRIMYAVDIKKESGMAARGPFQILEVVVPGAIFRGQIAVEKPVSDGVIKKPVQLQVLLDSSRNFFSKEHKREIEELKTTGISAMEGMFRPEAIPIRVGRHSGAESMTIEGHRDIKIMGGKGKKDRWDDHATTIWLASDESKPGVVKNCRPFGWAEIGTLDPLIEKKFNDREKEWAGKIFNQQASLLIQSDSGIHEIDASRKGSQVEPKKVPEPEIWEKVILLYAPNTQMISAGKEGKTATTKEKKIIPEPLLEKMIKKKKTVTVTLKVELIGGKAYRIIEAKE